MNYSKVLREREFVPTGHGGTDQDAPVPGTYFVVRFEGDAELALTVAYDEAGKAWIAFASVPLCAHGFRREDVEPLSDSAVYRACLRN